MSSIVSSWSRRAVRPLAAACLATVALAGPAAAAGGTGVTVTSVANGTWSDGAIWDAGVPPTTTNSDIVAVRHLLTVDSAESVFALDVGVPFIGTGLTVLPGGSLESDLTLLGGPGGLGMLRLEGGTADLGLVEAGSASGASGDLSLRDGTLLAAAIDLGHPSGAPAAMQVFDATVSIDQALNVWGGGRIFVRPTASGAAGHGSISTHDVSFAAGSALFVLPEYPAEVGDSWDVLTYTGTLSGLPELVTNSPWVMALDTSTPGVVRVTVTASIYPIPGNTCDDAIALDANGDSHTYSVADHTSASEEPVCSSAMTVTSDFWFLIENAVSIPRAYSATVSQSSGDQSLQLFESCGGSELACVPPFAPLEFIVPANGARLVRVTSVTQGFYDVTFDLVPTPWVDLGGASSGALGAPQLTASGPLTAGSDLVLELDNTQPGALFLLWLSVTTSPVQVVGGTLHALPGEIEVLLGTDAAGEFSASTPVGPGTPPLPFWMQCIVEDGTSIHGITLSNGVQGLFP